MKPSTRESQFARRAQQRLRLAQSVLFIIIIVFVVFGLFARSSGYAYFYAVIILSALAAVYGIGGRIRCPRCQAVIRLSKRTGSPDRCPRCGIAWQEIAGESEK